MPISFQGADCLNDHAPWTVISRRTFNEDVMVAGRRVLFDRCIWRAGARLFVALGRDWDHLSRDLAREIVLLEPRFVEASISGDTAGSIYCGSQQVFDDVLWVYGGCTIGRGGKACFYFDDTARGNHVYGHEFDSCLSPSFLVAGGQDNVIVDCNEYSAPGPSSADQRGTVMISDVMPQGCAQMWDAASAVSGSGFVDAQLKELAPSTPKTSIPQTLGLTVSGGNIKWQALMGATITGLNS